MRAWNVRLSASAEADFEHIIAWTVTQFGEQQALRYADTILSALAALSEGPSILGTRARDDISKGLLSLHVARQGRKGRHLILFRVDPTSGRNVIEVIRLLHDSMDLPRYLELQDD